jgi:hypothetical protein
LLDACKTVLCALASLCVGHAEHVVGLYSAVKTAVARYRCAELEPLRLVLDAVERSDCLVLVLVAVASVLGNLVRSLCRVNNIGRLDAKERVH